LDKINLWGVRLQNISNVIKNSDIFVVNQSSGTSIGVYYEKIAEGIYGIGSVTVVGNRNENNISSALGLKYNSKGIGFYQVPNVYNCKPQDRRPSSFWDFQLCKISDASATDLSISNAAANKITGDHMLRISAT
jgi:hypothetical protein